MDYLARTHLELSGRRSVHGYHPSICDRDPSLPPYVSISQRYVLARLRVILLCCEMVSKYPSAAGQETRDTHPVPLIDSTPRPLATVLVVLDGRHASTRDSKHLSLPSAFRPVSQLTPGQAHGRDDPIGDQCFERDGHCDGSIGL